MLANHRPYRPDAVISVNENGRSLDGLTGLGDHSF